MMAKLILGLFIGAGIALTWVSIVEVEERKKSAEMERWRSKLP